MTDCKTCSKPILPPSPICSYENNNYHPECLTCVTCKLTLSGKKFIKEKNGSLICEGNDYELKLNNCINFKKLEISF